MDKCKVITIISCKELELRSDYCANCELLNWWTAFETESECNTAYKNEYPEEFDKNGNEIVDK